MAGFADVHPSSFGAQNTAKECVVGFTALLKKGSPPPKRWVFSNSGVVEVILANGRQKRTSRMGYFPRKAELFLRAQWDVRNNGLIFQLKGPSRPAARMGVSSFASGLKDTLGFASRGRFQERCWDSTFAGGKLA